MMKRWIALLLLAVMLCGLWAVPASAATYATVVGGWLRLRVNPSYDAVIITSYKSGSVVTVISQSAGWARVLTSDYRLGYMDTHYLLMEGGTPPSPSTPVPSTRTWTTVNRVAYVTSQNGKGVRLRSAPEVNKYNVMGLYPVGRTVTQRWLELHQDRSEIRLHDVPVPDHLALRACRHACSAATGENICAGRSGAVRRAAEQPEPEGGGYVEADREARGNEVLRGVVPGGYEGAAEHR